MRLLALVSLLALGACNPRPVVYPPGVELTFVNSCQAQGSSAELCGCVWERVEAEVPADDFAALERLPLPEREAHPLMAQIRGYRETCSVAINPPPAPDAEEPVPAP
ncbi:MAG: hypothetical protein AB7H66_02995 [Hyphomonadaceae bacterium]